MGRRPGCTFGLIEQCEKISKSNKSGEEGTKGNTISSSLHSFLRVSGFSAVWGILPQISHGFSSHPSGLSAQVLPLHEVSPDHLISDLHHPITL